jgi:hypothetical protein
MGVGGQRHAPVVLPPNDLVSIVEENGWASGLVWTGAEKSPLTVYIVYYLKKIKLAGKMS